MLLLNAFCDSVRFSLDKSIEKNDCDIGFSPLIIIGIKIGLLENVNYIMPIINKNEKYEKHRAECKYQKICGNVRRDM